MRVFAEGIRAYGLLGTRLEAIEFRGLAPGIRG